MTGLKTVTMKLLIVSAVDNDANNAGPEPVVVTRVTLDAGVPASKAAVSGSIVFLAEGDSAAWFKAHVGQVVTLSVQADTAKGKP